MENETMIERLSSSFTQSATAKSVFGEPVTAGNKTILPVAKVAYGFGGGFGRPKKKDHMMAPPSDNPTDQKPMGAGGGGGLRITPTGVYEITPTATRFVPAQPLRHLAAGIVLGILLKTFLLSK